MHCSLKVNISIHLINRQNSLQMLNAWVVQCRQEWKKLHRIVISFLKENEICKCQIFKWGSWLFLWLKICACDGNEISMFTVTWEFLMCVYIYTHWFQSADLRQVHYYTIWPPLKGNKTSGILHTILGVGENTHSTYTYTLLGK